jgi:omega-6 fatty acid desaturase (delta-12 desaturase)
VQHQFDGTYWQYKEEWDYFNAGMLGSSYYKLPRVLQWFTANIGLHHIHHLDSRIPNYRLQECHDENPIFQKATVMTFFESFSCISLKLWDEKRGNMISFRELKKMQLLADEQG